MGSKMKQPLFGQPWWRSNTFQCRRSRCWGGSNWAPWDQWSALRRTAADARNAEAVTASRGWGGGANKPSCGERQQIHQLLGRNGPTAQPSWTCCNLRCTTADCRSRTYYLQSGQKCYLELRDSRDAPRLARSMRHGGPGSWVLSPGWTHFQCQLLRGQRHWPAVGAGHTDLCWRGWMPTRSSCCHGLASCVVMPPGMSVAIAWKLFALTALRTHWHKVAQCLDKSFAARKWQQGKEFAAQPHLCGHPRVDVKLPKPSCNSSRLGEKVGALLMVGALVLQQQQVVSCGNDDRKPPLPVASGPSSSSQRPPPSQVGPARWAAVTALETAARERVLAWRLEKGLEDDADFAYRWASHEEAIAGAGHAVAHEWLRIRAEQVVTLLPTVAQVMDDLPKPSPSMAPAILRETRGKPKAMASGRRRTGVRLRANPSDAPEAITARVEALTGVMMRLGALAPSGSMTASLQAEWHQACTRLSQRLITNAEKSTVLNALTTAEELRQFMRLRDRGCAPEKVDLDAFLHSPSTKAPVRALASLKWLNNNGQLGWSIQDLIPPIERRGRRARAGQAVPIAPPMLAFTEETIERMHKAQNEKWTALSLVAGWWPRAVWGTPISPEPHQKGFRYHRCTVFAGEASTSQCPVNFLQASHGQSTGRSCTFLWVRLRGRGPGCALTVVDVPGRFQRSMQ